MLVEDLLVRAHRVKWPPRGQIAPEAGIFFIRPKAGHGAAVTVSLYLTASRPVR